MKPDLFLLGSQNMYLSSKGSGTETAVRNGRSGARMSEEPAFQDDELLVRAPPGDHRVEHLPLQLPCEVLLSELE